MQQKVHNSRSVIAANGFINHAISPNIGNPGLVSAIILWFSLPLSVFGVSFTTPAEKLVITLTEDFIITVLILMENLMPEKMLIKSKKTVTSRAVLGKEQVIVI